MSEFPLKIWGTPYFGQTDYTVGFAAPMIPIQCICIT